MTNAGCIALQLEHVARMLPTMFPGRIATATVRYRYSWETELRVKKGMEFFVCKYSDFYLDTCGDSTKGEVNRAAERRLKRWHWTDRAGRVRRVQEVHVTITAMRDDPPADEQRTLADHFAHVPSRIFRIPLTLNG